MRDRPRDSAERTFGFAPEVTRLCRVLYGKPGIAPMLARQLLRSGTSIGANVEEAQAGQSRADFLSKYAIALKEARETGYWLRSLEASGECTKHHGKGLQQEADEIARIIGSIIVNAKKSGERGQKRQD